MSVVRDLILQADDQLRYPTGGELRSMVEFLSGGARRLSVVRVLTDNEKKIVAEASKGSKFYEAKSKNQVIFLCIRSKMSTRNHKMISSLSYLT